MSKRDLELPSIIFCQSQRFRVVKKKLIRFKMKLLLQKPTDTRRSFLVSLHKTNGYYCIDGRSVCSQFLQTNLKYIRDKLSNVCQTCSSHDDTPAFPSNRTQLNSILSSKSEEVRSASHDQSFRAMQTQELYSAVFQQQDEQLLVPHEPLLAPTRLIED